MKKLKVIIFVILVIFILIITPVLDIPLYLMARPSKNITDLHSFLEWKPKTETITKVEKNSTVYYICYGRAGRLYPSGPSAYYFDSNLSFFGWTPDCGGTHGSIPKEVYEQKSDNQTELKIEEVIQVQSDKGTK